jgi:mRNA-degrading endonuclease HigB of HigAB toxin-antitoxin module
LKVVAINRIKEAQARYPAASEKLAGWYQILSQGDFYSEKALLSTFGDMRGFNYQYRFPIPETTLLVHTLLNFESQVAYIDEIKPGNH